MANFPVEQVGSLFPALGTSTPFLDNPAGTQLPTESLLGLDEQQGAIENADRGMHSLNSLQG
jgi:hypothetical protein